MESIFYKADGDQIINGDVRIVKDANVRISE